MFTPFSTLSNLTRLCKFSHSMTKDYSQDHYDLLTRDRVHFIRGYIRMDQAGYLALSKHVVSSNCYLLLLEFGLNLTQFHNWIVR